MRPERSEGLSFQIPRRVVRRFYACVFAANGLFILVTLLSDLNLLITTSGIARHFDLKTECTVAVWYSSMLLLVTGAAALSIGNTTPPAGVRVPWYRAMWTLAALFFVGLSADEAGQLHETLGIWFTRRFGSVSGLTDIEAGQLVFVWVLVLLPLIVVFIVLILLVCRWWLVHHKRSRNLALLGVGCWVGVILAEVAQSQMARWSMERSVQGVIEEGLEISGTLLFLMAFLEFLQDRQQSGQPAARPVLSP